MLGLDISVWWLLAGALLVLLEVMLLPGIGFLFAGLAAIVVGGLITINVVPEGNTLVQFVWFFCLTAFWAAALWVPMKRLRYKTSGKQYQHMIGDTAVVKNAPLTKTHYGQVSWSGTMLKARIASDAAVETLAEGTEVVIVELNGSKVYVKPKN